MDCLSFFETDFNLEKQNVKLFRNKKKSAEKATKNSRQDASKKWGNPLLNPQRIKLQI